MFVAVNFYDYNYDNIAVVGLLCIMHCLLIHEQLIAHYHNKTDGLLCKLATPCERSGFRRKVRGGPFAN